MKNRFWGASLIAVMVIALASFIILPAPTQAVFGDSDDDTVLNANDNCPLTANTSQTDSDSDGIGDACDDTDSTDYDDDLVSNAADNCIFDANAGQADTDGDGLGDVCDSTSGTDPDGDGVTNVNDNCPVAANLSQTDADNDGIGDACDPLDNRDVDGDGVINSIDNCVLLANAGQADSDADGIGDTCDEDIDGTYVLTTTTAIPSEVNSTSATYYFSVTGDGDAEYYADDCGNGSNLQFTSLGGDLNDQQVTITGLLPDFTYQCEFWVENLIGESDPLQIGPFTYIPSTSSSGSRRKPKPIVPDLVPILPINPSLPFQPATITSAHNLMVRNLWLGNNGDDVKQLQLLLIGLSKGSAAKALGEIGATGYFGRYTQSALSEYQKLNGIMPTFGFFGPITRAQMKAAGLLGLWW